MWQKHLQDAWHHGKRTVGNMWNNAVKLAGDLDHVMNISKRIFSVAHPMIQDIGGSNVNRAIVSGLGRYEQGRDQVLGQYNNVQSTLSRLRRAVPEIDL